MSVFLPPPPIINGDIDSYVWRDWFRLLSRKVNDGTIEYSTHNLAGYSFVILATNHAGTYPVSTVRVFNPIGNEVEVVYVQTTTEITITSNVELSGHTAYIY